MSELIDMASQFKGLPMGDLIGGPLTAASDAQVQLARATADFIKAVGFEQGADGKNCTTRQVDFSFTRPTVGPKGEATGYEEKVNLSVPLLSIVKIPNLSVTSVDVTFDMEVKSSFMAKESLDMSASMDASVKFGWGPVSGTVRIQGSVASHKENTRTSDNSAKYHVNVQARDGGTPEGLARVLDILQTASAPRAISAPQAVALASDDAKASGDKTKAPGDKTTVGG